MDKWWLVGIDSGGGGGRKGGRSEDAQGKVLQAKFAWAGSIVKGLAPKALGAESRIRRP